MAKSTRVSSRAKIRKSVGKVDGSAPQLLHPELKLQRRPQSLDHEMLPRTLDSAINIEAFSVPLPKPAGLFARFRSRFSKSRVKTQVLTTAVVGIVLGSVAMFAPASSFFNDTESTAGAHETGILDITLDKNNWDPNKKLKPGDETTREITVEQEGTLDFIYEPTVKITGGKQNFCKALVLTVSLADQQLYQGPLPDLQIPEPISSQDLPHNWEFSVMLPGQLDNFDEDKCEFNFIFTAWQEELTKDTGFTDTEKVENEIRSDKKKKNNNNHNDNNYLNGDNENDNTGTPAIIPNFLPLNLPDLPNLPELPTLPELPEIPQPDTEQIEEVLNQQQELLDSQQEAVEEVIEEVGEGDN